VCEGAKNVRAQGMTGRLSVGLCALFGLLSGCATGGEVALSPNIPQVAGAPHTDCEGGEAKACDDLGWRYAKGLGVPKDKRRAATLFEQACTGGYAVGCRNLGVLYAQGLGVPKDERRAATLYEQACTAGISKACAMR